MADKHDDTIALDDTQPLVKRRWARGTMLKPGLKCQSCGENDAVGAYPKESGRLVCHECREAAIGEAIAPFLDWVSNPRDLPVQDWVEARKNVPVEVKTNAELVETDSGESMMVYWQGGRYSSSKT